MTTNFENIDKNDSYTSSVGDQSTNNIGALPINKDVKSIRNVEEEAKHDLFVR